MSHGSQERRPEGLLPGDQQGLIKLRAKRFAPFSFAPAPLSRPSQEKQEISVPRLSYTINIDASTSPQGMTLVPGHAINRQEEITSFEQKHPCSLAGLRRFIEDVREQKGMFHGDYNYAFTEPRIIEQSSDSVKVALDWMKTKYLYSRYYQHHYPDEIPYFAQVAGTNVVWQTTEVDGSHKLVVVQRHEGNGLYGGTLGIVGGGWEMEQFHSAQEGEKRKQKSGFSSMEPTRRKANNNNFHETNEEICVPYERLEKANMEILGISSDNRLPHKDILMFGTLPVTHMEIFKWQKPELDNQGHKLQNPADPAVFCDATPQGIAQLLNQDKFIVTPATTANLLLVGKRMIYQTAISESKSQREAVGIAESWQKQLESKISIAEENKNKIVEQHYIDHPEDLQDTQSYRPLRDPHAYHPAYDAARKQGLMTPRQGMNRLFATTYSSQE